MVIPPSGVFLLLSVLQDLLSVPVVLQSGSSMAAPIPQ